MMEEQKFILENPNSFNLVHIFECGQCFRWNIENDGSYTGVIKSGVLNVKQNGKNFIFNGKVDGDIEEIVKQYFDLNTDYEALKQKLAKVDMYLKESIDYGYGIRILNQDLWECIISFIISANNNIPRIKKIIEKLSLNYGNEIEFNRKKLLYFSYCRGFVKS